MIKKTIIAASIFLPNLAFAATPRLGTLADVINLVNSYLGMIIPLIFSIAVVCFIWGISRYFTSGGEKLEEAKSMALYGIIGLFVMFSVWGLVNILLNTFGFNSGLPTIKTGGSTMVPAGGGMSTGNQLVPAGGGTTVNSNALVPAGGGQSTGSNMVPAGGGAGTGNQQYFHDEE